MEKGGAMRRTLRLGQIAGIDIKIHWSMLLVIWLLFPRGGTFELRRLLLIVLAVVLVFACILAHELGHALTARWRGISTRSIVLWPLGGFANLSRMPERPWDDLLISAAGPLVNLGLAGLCFVLVLLRVGLLRLWPHAPPELLRLPESLLTANLLLAGFNLIPAFPLDGGRIARAVLHMLLGRRRGDLVTLGLSWVLAALLLVIGVRSGDWTLMLGAGVVFVAAAGLRNAPAGPPASDDPAAPLVRQGAFDAALLYYDQHLAHSPQDAPGYVRRALVLTRKGSFGPALDDCDRALRLDPALASAYHMRGTLRYLLGQHALALADFGRPAEQAPDRAQSFLIRAAGFDLARDYDRALADCERALALSPNDLQALAQRAASLIQIGDHQRAADDCARLLALAPQQPAGYVGRADLHALLGQPAAALADYEQALALDPYSQPALVGRAPLLQRAGRSALARESLDCGLALDPQDLRARLLRCLVCYEQGDLAAASADREQILARPRAQALLRSERELCDPVGRHAGWAMFFYDHAVARFPDDPLALQGRADAWRALQQHERALADYDRAIALASERAEPYAGRAASLLALGRRTSAAADLRAAIQLTDNLYLRRVASAQLAQL